MFEETYKLTFYDKASRATQSVGLTTANLSLTNIKRACKNYDPDYRTLEISSPVVVTNRDWRS